MLADQRLRALLLLTAIVAIAALVFAVDSRIPAGLGGGVAYSLCVVLALWLPWRHSAIVAALAGSLLNTAALQVSAPEELGWAVLASRACGFVAIWAAALAGRHQMEVGRALEGRVSDRTRELSLANEALQHEIGRREEVSADLRRREAYLELVIDTARAVVVLLGPQGEIVEWNREAELLYGVSKEEALGLDYFDHFPAPENADSVRALHRQMLESGEALRNVETTVTDPDGTEHDIIWSGVAMQDADGKTYGVLGVGIDISERMHAEREREELLRFEKLVCDISAELVSANVADLDRAVGFGLRSLGELMGVDRCTIDFFGDESEHVSSGYLWISDEFAGHTEAEPDRPKLLASMPWLREQMQRAENLVITGPGRLPEEATGELEVGKRYGIRSAVIVPMLVDGTAIGFLGLSLLKEREREWPEPLVQRLRHAAEIIGNALVRRRTEEQLRNATAETQAILQTAVDAVISVGADGTVKSLNPSAEAMFGYREDEIFGRSVLALARAADQPLYVDLITNYAETGETTHFLEGGREMIGVRKDGSTFPLFVTMGRSTSVGGHERFTVFGRDLTREKAMEQRVRAAASEAVLAEQRERKGLARDLHDGLGQLLSLASMKLGALRDTAAEQELRERVRDIEDVIGEADRRTTSLTFQLSPPVLDDVGLVAAAQWLAEDLERLYGLQVSVTHDGSPTPLDEAGRVTLFRALRELLINVAKHAGVDRAKVQIHTEHQRVLVSVEDPGLGFDPNMETGGYGLLSLCERVEHLGGTLEIKSAPGEGAQIVVSAPVANAAEKQGEKSQ